MQLVGGVRLLGEAVWTLESAEKGVDMYTRSKASSMVDRRIVVRNMMPYHRGIRARGGRLMIQILVKSWCMSNGKDIYQTKLL